MFTPGSANTLDLSETQILSPKENIREAIYLFVCLFIYFTKDQLNSLFSNFYLAAG